jgi:UDP-2-acetamido-3-amino-2,3-dideoxy-glucuronate N-acetyltransferase
VELSDLAPGLVLGSRVTLGRGLVLGAHVVIHDGAIIGDGCVLGDHAVVGKPPLLGARSTVRGRPFGAAVREPGAAGGTRGTVFAGARIGRGAVVGDYAAVRERTSVGADSMVGRLCTLSCDVTVGAGVRLLTGTAVALGSVIEDEVFVGPGVMTADNPTAGREAGDAKRGVTLRRGCRIGAAAILLPGVEIGEEALVGAGAVVTRDVPARTAVVGVPARLLRQVDDGELLER